MSARELELVPEDELRELFRARRPQPADFRAGVERRLGVKRREAEEAAQREARHPLRTELYRRVAALFPPEVLGGTAGGSAAKLLPAALALPAMLLVVCVGALAASARSMLRSTRHPRASVELPRRVYTEPPKPRNPDMDVGVGLFRKLQSLGFVLIFAPTFLGGRWALDGLLVAIILCAASLAITLRGLASAEALTRAEVVRLCGGLLAATFFAFLPFMAGRFPYAGTDLGVGWSIGTMLVGVVLCLLCLVRIDRSRTVVFRLTMSVLVLPLLNVTGVTRASPAGVREVIERFDVAAAVLDDWELPAAAWEALRAIGATPPDVGPLAREVNRRIHGREVVHYEALTAAARMGILAPESWPELAKREAQELTALLDDGGSLPRDSEPRIHVLLRTRELTPAEREHLLSRIEASWPTVGDFDALEDAARCTRLFDLLGRPERAAIEREAVQELLRQHWVPRARRGAGGFDRGADASHSSEEGTWSAVELMARYGVPEGIDLRLVRGFLRAEARPVSLVLDPPVELGGLSRCALLRLEREIGIPPRSWIEHIVGERLFIATLLLVALCLVAIWRVPAPQRETSVGALP